jgi:hypothetical protein
MPERTILGLMKTDDQGWPLIRFTPEDESLHAVAAFLQEDVDILLPACDELLQAMGAVLEGKEEEWTWNGNRFLVRVRRDRASLTDKYGPAGLGSAPVTIDTALLARILDGWRDFVSDLPRQRECASSGSG